MRILIFSDLKKRGIHYSREHIRRRECVGTFPQHIELGKGRIGWIEEEIDAWIADLMAARNSTTIGASGPAVDSDRAQPAIAASTRRTDAYRHRPNDLIMLDPSYRDPKRRRGAVGN